MSDNGIQGLLPNQEPEGTGGENNDLASGFLANVPVEDRNVVEKYIKEWDQNVSKRFETIHDSYKPYKELGEIETLQNAVRAMNLIENDPVGTFKFMAEELKRSGTSIEEVLGIAPQKPEPTQQPNPFGQGLGSQQQTPQGLPKEWEEKFAAQEKVLAQVSQFLTAQEQAKVQAEQDQLLDKHLTDLRAKHGEFDTDWVMLKAHRDGMELDKAVQEFHKKFGKPGAPSLDPPPLFGGSIPPTGAQGIAEMSREDAKKLVADFLQGTQRNSL